MSDSEEEEEKRMKGRQKSKLGRMVRTGNTAQGIGEKVEKKLVESERN